MLRWHEYYPEYARAARTDPRGPASVIKPVKIGDEHGEVAFRVGEQIERGLCTAAGVVIAAAYERQDEIRRLAPKLWQAFAGRWGLSVLAAGMLLCVATMLHGLFIADIQEERRRRRYLLGKRLGVAPRQPNHAVLSMVG